MEASLYKKKAHTMLQLCIPSYTTKHMEGYILQHWNLAIVCDEIPVSCISVVFQQQLH